MMGQFHGVYVDLRLEWWAGEPRAARHGQPCSGVGAPAFDEAAPLSEGDARHRAGKMGREQRRGPRSLGATLRRRLRLRKRSAAPFAAGEAPSQTGADSPVVLRDLHILHHNIRGYISHRAELEAHMLHLDRAPDIAALTETFLDHARAHVESTNYICLARRDRMHGAGGGLVVFVRAELENSVTHVEKSGDAERIWLLLHTEMGPVTLGVWYRPPACGEFSLRNVAERMGRCASRICWRAHG